MSNQQMQSQDQYQQMAPRTPQQMLQQETPVSPELDTIDGILAEIEQALEEAKTVPFSDKVLVDREGIYDLLTEIKVHMPTEIEQSRWVIEEKNRILVEAQQRAEAIIREAHEEHQRLVDNEAVSKDACKQAEDIVEASKRVAKDMRMGATEYADDLLAQIDDQMKQLASFTNDELGKLIGIIDKRNKEFEALIDQKSRILQQNRKELDIHHE
ncbi:MAG: hypothetical protein HUJ69_00545 [Lachnospiraceae bacterium]|nr:hypothetical protein [Lachnospiraceae bacterium]